VIPLSPLGLTAMNSVAEIAALETLCRSNIAAGEALRSGSLSVVVETGSGISVEVETEEELFVLTEIFLRGVYERQLSGPYTVVDVGMNIGMTSLFFAAKPEVAKVIGYELLRPTYEAALRNLTRNPELQAKIQANPYGLWSSDSIFEVAYDKERRCGLGIGVDPVISDTLEPVLVRRASTELATLLDTCGTPVVLKLDCEGAEYEILEDLAASSLLPRFKAVLCEWHRKGPDALTRLLETAGFAVEHKASSSPDTGMLYAVIAPCALLEKFNSESVGC